MADSIARYLGVRQAYGPSFASDGRDIAFLTDITGVPQVWQVGVSGGGEPGWPDQRTFETERVQGVWHSPTSGDDRLIYARDTGGNENAQLFLLHADGEEQALTADYPRAMHSFGEWSADGKQILFAANRRDPGLFDLYLQPLDGAARLVWQQDAPGFLPRQAFSPDGRHATVVRTASSFRHELFEIDLQSGAARPITPSVEDARYGGVYYSQDGTHIYVNTDLGSDFLHLARLDLKTLRIEPLVSVDWDIELVTGSPDRQTLAYVVNEDGRGRLTLLHLASGKQRSVPTLGEAPGLVGYLDGRLSFSADSQRLAFSYTSATRASDIYVWDLRTDHVAPATRSSHGGLPLDSFVAPELIRYPTFDERLIPAWFFKPRSDKPAPVVVVAHGGPEAQFLPYFNFLAQYLLHHGYAVFAPNVRGSTGYGKAYSHLDDGRKRMDSVADLAYAARWLREQPAIDASRLAIYGGSYGGFMVLAALTTYPDLWAAGVDIVGVSNFRTFLENTSDYRRAHREAEYGSLQNDRDFLESIAPSNQVDQIRAPLMVIHGANDPRVPLSEARQLVSALEARGVPAPFLVFEDEGHGIVKLKNKLVAFPAIVDFLDTHLMRPTTNDQ